MFFSIGEHALQKIRIAEKINDSEYGFREPFMGVLSATIIFLIEGKTEV